MCTYVFVCITHGKTKYLKLKTVSYFSILWCISTVTFTYYLVKVVCIHEIINERFQGRLCLNMGFLWSFLYSLLQARLALAAVGTPKLGMRPCRFKMMSREEGGWWMSSGRRDGFCNDTNEWSTESPVPALTLRTGNQVRKGKQEKWMRGWRRGEGACAIKEKRKSCMLLMGQECRGCMLRLSCFSFSCT